LTKNDERGTYLPLTWNRETGELGVHLPEQEDFDGHAGMGSTLDDYPELMDKQPPKLAHPMYMVEAICTYRMRYVVSCKNAEHAMDTVTMEEAKEFSQLHLGEQIIGAREIGHDEMIDICDADNDYGSSWPVELKYKNFVTVVDYNKD
jgi:hypothetical protein